MDEYISKEDILDIVSKYCPDDDGSCSKADVDLKEMLDEIEVLPVVDAQPINPLVKVEERVPNVSGNYLCYLTTDEFEVLYFDRGIEDDEYNLDYPFGVWNTYPSDDGGECREWIEVLEVTHWMPLPKTPKE